MSEFQGICKGCGRYEAVMAHKDCKECGSKHRITGVDGKAPGEY